MVVVDYAYHVTEQGNDSKLREVILVDANCVKVEKGKGEKVVIFRSHEIDRVEVAIVKVACIGELNYNLRNELDVVIDVVEIVVLDWFVLGVPAVEVNENF